MINGKSTATILDAIDTTDVLANMVWTASYHKALSVSYRKAVDRYIAEGDYPASKGHNEKRWLEVGMMRAAIFAMGTAIRTRTMSEKIEAEAMVMRDDARFAEPGCEGDTCDSCNRPIWHHILLRDGGIMCPTTRRFWSVARALLAGRHELSQPEKSGLLREIAKRP